MLAVSFTPRPLYPRGESSVRPIVKRMGGRESQFERCGKEANVYWFSVWSVVWEFIYIRVTKLSVAQNMQCRSVTKSVPVDARSMAWVYGRLPAETVGSNPTGGMVVCLL
jgi:hypothetical protein